MDRRERAGSPDTALLAFADGFQAGIWTAMPGIIQSFDPTKQTCTVQPSLRCDIEKLDGEVESVDMPLLVDCPVQFPRGGGVALTFPVAVGDECLVVFASRCIDAWWQNGGVQAQAEFRMHDLSDGFVILGFNSVPNVMASISGNAVELRSVADNLTRISLDPTSKTAKMIVHNSFSGETGITITPGSVTITGALTINGEAYVAHAHTGVTPGGSNTGGKA